MYGTATAVLKGTTNLGTIAGNVRHLTLSDTVMNEQDVVCFSDGGGSGYYIFKDSGTTNLGTIAGNVRHLTLSDTVMNEQDVVCFSDGGGSGYYIFKDAVTTNF